MKKLIYNPRIERYVIVGKNYEHELHCGDYFEVLIADHWIRTTIEMKWTNGSGEYYLTTAGLSLAEIVSHGLPVRRN